MEVEAHDSTGSVAQELRVGGVLQGEHADHARLCLLVEIIWNQPVLIFISPSYLPSHYKIQTQQQTGHYRWGSNTGQ